MQVSASSFSMTVTGAVITRAGSQANVALEVGPSFPNRPACFATLDPETQEVSVIVGCPCGCPARPCWLAEHPTRNLE